MDESLQRYLFFVVTKGKQPGVYCSWEEAQQQVCNYTYPEFHCFNSYPQAVLAFESRISSIASEKAATFEMVGSSGETERSQMVSDSCGSCRSRPVVSWLPVIPGEELKAEFAIVNNMEEWLVKVCYESEIPSPCFFKEERFLRDEGPFFGFTVVLPGDPFEVELSAKGRFSKVEKAAREDAAVEMLDRVLQITRKEILDYNYAKVKLLRDTNNPLRAKVSELEEAYEKLKASYRNLVCAHIRGNSP